MRLKKIELKGFKSFGNTTVLHFNEDVVGVVGPNGSGKSNIVDAFRWVLGEQRTTGLRLDKMSDVLFNGTKTRRPANACSVTLIFENNKGLLPSEYQEVAISRHLYRSGNSEYRLNGVSCRLKDITSLLSDTGVGSNSYAIIALDMVDDILSDKDHARRKMFEQAAGISKFKQRKKEVHNKLKNSELDLERVQDLLFEINANLNQLQKQAKRARTFQKLRDKYRDQSILLGKLKIRDLKSSNTHLLEKLRQKEVEISEKKAEVVRLEAGIQVQKQTNLKEEERLNQSQKALAETVNELKETERLRDLGNQSIHNIIERNEKRVERIEELNESSQSVQNRIEYLQEKLEVEKSKTKAFKSRLELALKEKEEADNQSGVLSVKHREIEEENREKEALLVSDDRELSVIQSRIHSISEEMERMKEEESAECEKNRELDQSIEKLSSNYSVLEGKMEEVQLEENVRKEKLVKENQRKDQLEAELKKLERKLDSMTNERSLLKSMIEKLEGYPESIKHLNSKTDWKKNAGLLSELLYCPEEYRAAVEAVLSPWLDHYVVPDWKVAVEGMHFLQSAQKGKAQFILLDGIPEEKIAEEVSVPNAVRAIEIVEVDSTFLPLFKSLLSGVYIYNGEEMPSKLSEATEVLVHKSGKMVRRRQTAEGGSSDLFAGKKIGRKKALDLLDKKIAVLKVKVNDCLNEIRQAKTSISKLTHDDFQKQIKEIDRDITQLKTREAGIIATKKSVESTFEKRRDRLDQLSAELEELKKREAGKKAQLTEISREVEKLRTNISASRSRLDKALEVKAQKTEHFNQSNIELIQQQNKVQGHDNELQFQKGRLGDLNREIANLQKSFEEDKTKLEQQKSQLKDNQSKLVKMAEMRKTREAGLSENEQRYFKSKNEVFEEEKVLSEVHKSLNALVSVMDQMKESNREVDWKVRAIAERLEVEFDCYLSPDGIPAVTEEQKETDIIQLEKKVERLKSRLSNFGDVNPLALEAYEEMKLRYDDIQKQKEDIEQARDSLRETILEIETTAKERFLNAFERIRFNFINVFRSLFTEDDNCDLILTDPDNPLEADVEIIAKPRGKRPQSISQLSGGEKTLTAISLLFALYLLKPAPFCIFDEVDAPLDDANIQKFNRIIKTFSKDSQFIIVTHNKQTMSHLDIIYGVYMEESGVSGVSAVDFRSLKNEDFLTDVRETA